MSLDQHYYAATVTWTGNRGTGTSSYRDYGRDHDIEFAGLPTLKGSADPTFRGDPHRYNPEQLLLAALAQCHMLSYLHVAAQNGVVVTAYSDRAEGVMRLNRDGSGEFTSVTLHPQVSVADPAHAEIAQSLHTRANQLCFIARSVNFPVHHEPTTDVASAPVQG
ncbi:OsmC family protein [Pseudarthrobacter sp. J1738]|uniref:OsmC family protein n=1 Tax=Pseudarthrobacter sp. J1738 TaxID=3420446 RepID=UPI003D28CC3B